MRAQKAGTLIADMTFDAEARVITPLAAGEKTGAIPSLVSRRLPHDCD